MPERTLSDYMQGGSTSPAVATSASSGLPDAGEEAEVEGPSAPASELPTAAPSADAAPTNTLQCSEGCECERRNERDFMFCDSVVTHADAVVQCAAAGGALVSVDDEQQNDWLRERMQAAGAEDDFWLSGTDTEVEGVWRWQDGRVFFDLTGDAAASAAFVPWDVAQPNDLNDEDCMRSTDGVWRDLSCSSLIAFACQG